MSAQKGSIASLQHSSQSCMFFSAAGYQGTVALGLSSYIKNNQCCDPLALILTVK